MKLKTLALATSIALSAMSAVGTAHAGALATSVLDMTNFTIFKGGNILDRSAFNLLTITNTADVSANLNGVTSTDSGLGSGQDIDLGFVNVGGTGGYVENSYAVISNPPASTFAVADQSQFGSPIAGLEVGGVPIPTPATASQAAYVSLDTVGDGSSTANNGLTSSFIFTLGEGGELDFSFNARAYLEAFTDPAELFPTSASAQYSLFFTIDDLTTGTNVVNWQPDGISLDGTGTSFGITNEVDPFRLNDAVARNAPLNGTSFRGASEGTAFSGTWKGTTVALLEDNRYQLTIRSGTFADANAAVTAMPEPATLALMGLGILGLSLSRRRA